MNVDPIAELVHNLEGHGHARRAWIDRWSGDGDPVLAAWRASQDVNAMKRLLWLAGREDLFRRAFHAAGYYSANHCEECSRDGYVEHEDPVAHAQAVREAVPVPPRFDELPDNFETIDRLPPQPTDLPDE